MDTPNYLEVQLDDLLGRFAASGQVAAGSAAALTVAVAAGLAAMVARASRDSWEDAGGVAAQAISLQERAAWLIREDADAWQEAFAALGGTGEGHTAQRNFELEQKLERAAAVPLEIGELGATVAELAALAGELGEGHARADAVAAAALAAGATRAVMHLVEVNLGVREGDKRLAQARASEQAALEAVERALESAR